jgi:hypothetical protein
MKRTGVLFLLGFVLLFVSRSEARVFIVTDTVDTTGITSLRGAIITANRLGGRNTILLRGPAKRGKNFQPIFHLTISGPNEDRAQTGDLDITAGDLTILGSLPNTTIDASGFGDRVFQVFKSAHLTLSGLTITGGKAPGTDFNAIQGLGDGGAIYNAGVLNLANCTFTNNASGDGTFNEGNGGGNPGGAGGAIYNSGKVSMNKCLIQGNSCGDGIASAQGGDGGGIKNSGSCTLNLCSITGNRSGAGGFSDDGSYLGGSGGSGGGIFNTGTIALTRCIIDENLCGSGASGGQLGISRGFAPGGPGGNGGCGGGVYNLGQMQLDASSIYGNTGGNGGSGGNSGGGGSGGTAGNGGGIFNGGELILATSTISSNLCGKGGTGGNSAGGGGSVGAVGGCGGGIYNAGFVDLTSCTIVLNRANNGGDGGDGYAFFDSNVSDGGAGGSGGGIFNAGTNVVFTRNTLIALNAVGSGGQGGITEFDRFLTTPTNEVGNAGEEGIGPDVAGNFNSDAVNLIGAADGSVGLYNREKGNIVGSVASPIDPLIGPLQMNGGPTPTHALLPGSPAIDNGNSFHIPTDQRGVKRRFDYLTVPNDPAGDASDIGAFELNSPDNGI